MEFQVIFAIWYTTLHELCNVLGQPATQYLPLTMQVMSFLQIYTDGQKVRHSCQH